MPANDHDFCDDQMVATCPTCDAHRGGVFIGCLGTAEWFRCRQCGATFDGATAQTLRVPDITFEDYANAVVAALRATGEPRDARAARRVERNPAIRDEILLCWENLQDVATGVDHARDLSSDYPCARDPRPGGGTHGS